MQTAEILSFALFPHIQTGVLKVFSNGKL